MEAPERIFIDDPTGEFNDNWSIYSNNISTEYIRKDVFIEKVKEFLWAHTPGTDVHVNYIVKKFEKYMEE